MNRGGFLDRYPLNSPWIRDLVSRFWLPVWFATNSIAALALAARDTTLLYFDARLYLAATRTWLGGGDPWSVSLAGNYFAAPPPSLMPLVPIALLPIDIGVAVVAGLVIAGALATVRLLGLPWWWMLFPPLVQCVLSANVQGLLIPLILLRLGWLATLLKVYAGVPVVLLGRWRSIAMAIAVLLITAPFLPWVSYIEGFGTISSHLAEQTHFALPTLVLVLALPFALFAMAVVGREYAAWLAVPALWPAQQYYYGSLAIGARHGVAAAIVAVPIPGSGLLALFILAAIEWRGGRRPAMPARWSGRR